MEPDYMWMRGIWMGGMWMFPIIILIVLVIIGFLFVSRSGRSTCLPPHEPNKNETALDVLKKRYAKGEISKDEFERIKKDIT